MEPKEKKVEYIELIYDLIFVYIIGRNNTLLHTIRNGFIDPGAFLTYALTALIILQIWYATSLFINRYGENDKPMHVGIFVNMYLLYYMAQGIRTDWQGFYLYFNVAWALILLNLCGLYFHRLRGGIKEKVWENAQIRTNIITLLIQTGIILLSIPVFFATGLPLSPLAMVFGIIAALAGSKTNALAPVEFGHLTERVMLYVVFTFGEMIIGTATYFDDGFDLNTIYYSLLAFLIVAGLFVSYGVLYDRIVDRTMTTNGTAYMMLHVFLILTLNHITAALEFMREEEVADWPKNLFLSGSLVLYFALMYAIACCGRRGFHHDRTRNLLLLGSTAVFAVLMLLTYRIPRISIAVTLGYIAAIYVILLTRKCGCGEEAET